MNTYAVSFKTSAEERPRVVIQKAFSSKDAIRSVETHYFRAVVIGVDKVENA